MTRGLRLVPLVIVAVGLAGVGAALVGGGVVHAQAAGDERVSLAVDAFRTPAGPTVRFSETGDDPEQNAPLVGRMEIIRPASVIVARPPTRSVLGSLQFFVGPDTCPTCEDMRTYKLRRIRSLGNSYYLLGDAFGARVVLSTRYRTRFLTVSLPDKARNVRLTLSDEGARLLRFNCSRTSFVFEARFTQPADADRDTDSISRSRVNRAGLCGQTRAIPVR